MIHANWAIVKVGGSLFDLPDLRDRLRHFLTRLGERNVLLVPGGGSAADSIRELDRVHQLGEEASHWLAIQVLSLNACFLQALLPEARIVAKVPDALDSGSTEHIILDALPFFRADEARSDHLPHRWHVTSDSLAVRAAILSNARKLILLKSIAWDNDDWPAAAQAGVVDGFFTQALHEAPAGIDVRIVNLRVMA